MSGVNLNKQLKSLAKDFHYVELRVTPTGCALDARNFNYMGIDEVYMGLGSSPLIALADVKRNIKAKKRYK